MNILTTGHDFYAPIEESRTATEDVAAFRILLPRRDRDQRLWGSFQRGDRIAVRAEGRAGAPDVAVLDTFFRPVQVERSEGEVRFVAPESGVLYLVVPGGMRIGALRVTRRRRIEGRSTSFLSRAAERLLGRRARHGPRSTCPAGGTRCRTWPREAIVPTRLGDPPAMRLARGQSGSPVSTQAAQSRSV